jgi:hypothetical protein
MPSTRAWAIAPAIATSSRPPRQRRTSKRIAEACGVRRDPRRDRRRLRRQARVIHAGAPPGPVRGRAAVKRMRDRGGGGRVADPHLARHQKVGPGVDRVPARCQRLGEASASIAGPWVKSAVGRSSAMGTTSSRAPAISANWLIAAPPASKFATICAVTSAGKALTPRAVTPWFPAKTATCGARSAPASPRQPQYQIASSSSRPSAPGGFVNCPLRASAPARARLVGTRRGAQHAGELRRSSGGGRGHCSQLSIAEAVECGMSSQTAPARHCVRKAHPTWPGPRRPDCFDPRDLLRALALLTRLPVPGADGDAYRGLGLGLAVRRADRGRVCRARWVGSPFCSVCRRASRRARCWAQGS